MGLGRALGCPRRGPAFLHSGRGTDSVEKAGASAECDTEFGDAKGGVTSDTGFCIGAALDGSHDGAVDMLANCQASSPARRERN